MDEHWNIQAGQFEGIGHPFFIAKIRQADEDAIEFLAMLFEEFRAFPGVLMGLDAPQFGIIFSQLNGFDAIFTAEAGQVRPGFGYQLVGKEITVAVNDAQHGRFEGRFFHGFGYVSKQYQVGDGCKWILSFGKSLALLSNGLAVPT